MADWRAAAYRARRLAHSQRSAAFPPQWRLFGPPGIACWMWKRSGSGFEVRSTLNSETTVWKPCASITVHCLRAKLSGSNTSAISAEPPKVALSSISIVAELSSIVTRLTVVSLARSTWSLSRNFNGDAAAVGDDLEPRRRVVMEQHPSRPVDVELPLRALAVGADLDEIGRHHPRRVEIGVGALDRLLGRDLGLGGVGIGVLGGRLARGVVRFDRRRRLRRAETGGALRGRRRRGDVGGRVARYGEARQGEDGDGRRGEGSKRDHQGRLSGGGAACASPLHGRAL